jgi:hypothetical protein
MPNQQLFYIIINIINLKPVNENIYLIFLLFTNGDLPYTVDAAYKIYFGTIT